ncbi:MAG TPA: hypothetical protein VFW66_04200 [Gemmatimonadales bacterium]|nr:hypothetical protein [Gemmatimonadales bacterium]
MPLPQLLGHHDARRRLSRAASADQLPQVLLFTGPAGIGKQRLALWLAQRLWCERPGADEQVGEPCGQCRSCRQVLALTHPDLHWFVPVLRPKATEPDKQVTEVAEALAQVIEERRANPLYGPVDGMAIHGIASARLVLRHAALTPIEADSKLFVIGDAERLVPQESSPEAANALLKVLEEPSPRSRFVLTAEDPRRVLPTIRSRAVPLRVTPLSDAEVESVLRDAHRPPLEAEEMRRRAATAHGSVGAAISGGGADAAHAAAGAFIEAALKGRGAAMERSLKQPPWSARGDFSAMLDALAELLAEAARAAGGHEVGRPVTPALRRDGSGEDRLHALMAAQARVAAARDAAAGNVNPQLLLAVLADDLAEVL